MSVELIGLITLAVAAAGLVHSRHAALIVLCVAALLQAAAALFIGSANITPGHLSLGFFVLAVVIRKNGLGYAFSALQPPRAGFFLLALSVWGLFSSFVMPRLFAGQFMVFPMNSDTKFIIQTPLFPVSSNFNQAVYFLGGVLTFAFVSSMARTNLALHRAAVALLVAAIVNVAIAAVDTLTYAAGAANSLQFLRNAEYAQLFSHEFLGIKRVTGSFPEASAFAGTSIGLFAFAFRLWRGGIKTGMTGPIAIATFVAIIFALSSTGYVALIVYLVCAYARAITGLEGQIARNRKTAGTRATFVSMGPTVALLGAVIVAIRPDILEPVVAIFDNSITQKLGSASGVERMSWNMGGFRAFFETFGLGAGLGSVRTSSFVVGVLANLGLIGALLFGAFFVRLFSARNVERSIFADGRAVEYAAAARSGCFAMLVSASLSASSVDLGILFYVMAGMACAALFYRRVPAPDLVAEHDGPPLAAGVPIAAQARR